MNAVDQEPSLPSLAALRVGGGREGANGRQPPTAARSRTLLDPVDPDGDGDDDVRVRREDRANRGPGAPSIYERYGAAGGILISISERNYRRDVEARFPSGVVAEGLPGDAADASSTSAMQMARSILFLDDKWVFSCVPEWSARGSGDPVIRTLRSERIQGDADMLTVASAFAFVDTEKHKAAGGRCGSSNCFFKDVRADDGAAGSALARVVERLRPLGSSGSSGSSAPIRFAVRGPNAERKPARPETVARDVRRDLSEVVLTLEMAKRSLTPAVYAVFPVYETDAFEYATRVGFCYATEAGWVDLKRMAAERPVSDMELLGSAVVQCCRNTAEATVLLFDVKPPNMVARKTALADGRVRFEVRMIDFGAIFTVDANRHPPFRVARTTSDCVFFVNALLLLNFAARDMADETKRRAMFQNLALEVAATWGYMRHPKGTLSGFCGLLAKDASFAANIDKTKPGADGMPFDLDVQLGNLNSFAAPLFLEQMRETFYLVLLSYGVFDLVVDDPVQTRLSSPLYVDRLVKRIQDDWGVADADVKKRVDEIVAERNAGVDEPPELPDAIMELLAQEGLSM